MQELSQSEINRQNYQKTFYSDQDLRDLGIADKDFDKIRFQLRVGHICHPTAAPERRNEPCTPVSFRRDKALANGEIDGICG